jgi:hypothetical protein
LQPDYEFRRGPRANLEIPEETVITFAAEVLQTDPQPLIQEFRTKKEYVQMVWRQKHWAAGHETANHGCFEASVVSIEK